MGDMPSFSCLGCEQRRIANYRLTSCTLAGKMPQGVVDWSGDLKPQGERIGRGERYLFERQRARSAGIRALFRASSVGWMQRIAMKVV